MSAPPPDTIKGWGDFFEKLVSDNDEGHLIVIELSVLLTSVFLVLLFIYGGLRRRFHVGGWFTVLMKGVYILTPVMITYIMGLMRNTSSSNVLFSSTAELFPVWALILIYIYGGVDSMTVCDLRDNEKVLQYALHIVPLFFWAVWLANFTQAAVTIPIVLLFLLALWNTKETLQAMFKASLSRGLLKFIHPIVDYMRDAKYNPTDSHSPSDPVSMKGYSYFVGEYHVKPEKEPKIITTEGIWQCGGRLGEEDTTALKDIALSYALSLLLLRRFAGFTLHESDERRQSLSFVHDRLLSSLDPQRVERMFHLIEVELSFVFDFFYTKLNVITSRGSFYKLRRLFCVPFFVIAASLLNHPDFRGIVYHGYSMEVLLTKIVLYIIAVLELWQICMYFLSYWKIFYLVCHYVKQKKEKARLSCVDGIKGWIMVWLWRTKKALSEVKIIGFFMKPWQRKLGQYSFLESYAKVPVLRSARPLSRFLTVPRVGQRGDSTVPLSKDVKMEVASSLKRNDFSSPFLTLAQVRHGVFYNASKRETAAELILVCHIATSACAERFKPAKGSTELRHYNAATHISKYCAYLVTFAPKLLPDHHYTTELIFDNAVRDALVLLKDKTSLTQRVDVLFSHHEESADGRNVLLKGAALARSLSEHVKGDSSKGWTMLAEFWADLLLYITPSPDNAITHGVHLAEGGEFITHLWALLTHAGIVNRLDHFPLVEDTV